MDFSEDMQSATKTLAGAADIFEDGKLYEVIVDDKLNPTVKTFAFGINGKLGEYPTNTKIKLRGELIRHLYNCVFLQPETQDSNDGQFRRIVGTREVCRFAITPTSWGALPEGGVLLGSAGRQVPNEIAASDKAVKAAAEQNKGAADAYDNGVDVNADISSDILAEKQREYELKTKEELIAIAKERGVKNYGNKAEILDALMEFEEKQVKGE